ncbi:hypothetical protein, partial [Hoylesella shahii]|uniref:hypothetical protein n=1 Tax=Hoylesella shahii TaxID=228603 RepID=UPI0028EA7E28
MGFFKNQLNKQLDNFKQSIPDERLDELEAQGYDVSEYRQAKQAVRGVGNVTQEEIRNGQENCTNLSKLEPYMKTPRSTENEFFKSVAGKAPWFGKDKWRRKYSEGPIVYRGVVAAQSELYRPGNNVEDAFYAITIVAVDKEHQCNEAWMQRVIKQLQDMQAGKVAIPSDCAELVDVMNEVDNEGDWRSGMLGMSIAEGAEAHYRKDVL